MADRKNLLLFQEEARWMERDERARAEGRDWSMMFSPFPTWALPY
jgi:hypothetical protein